MTNDMGPVVCGRDPGHQCTAVRVPVCGLYSG